jgi:hypothetical protein
LGEVEGICKLVAFCKNQLTGDISAAFDFNEHTLEELISVPLSTCRVAPSKANITNSISSFSEKC